MDFRQAEVFLAVVEHGSLGKAAIARRLTQPAVSQTIRALERDFRTPLFHRVGSGLVLTPAGEAVVKPARQILRDLATARASVAEVSGAPSGTLELAAIYPVFEQPLIELIGAFRRDHPGVTVRVTEPDNEEVLLQQVHEGRVELGFCHLPTAGPHDVPGLTTHVIGRTELCVVMPPHTRPDLPDPLPFAEIPDLPVVAAPGGAVARLAVEERLRAAGMRTRLGVVTANRSMQIPLVLAGTGMAWTGRRSADLAEVRGAVVRSLAPPISLPQALMHRPGHLAPSARALRDLAVQRASTA
ncbi:LysR family transcriptional regulator [Saccharopolyspora sp. NPDC050642]|uniref:LysR family transcriptional regulator n=1 Tax=Saccharopolyspora sp. NPDC050642 TaxID=3157099 RepID=UPI0033CE44FE